MHPCPVGHGSGPVQLAICSQQGYAHDSVACTVCENHGLPIAALLLAVVPPREQWQNSYAFAVDTTAFPDVCFINVMYVGTNPTGVLLNGVSVSIVSWTRVAGVANTWTAQVWVLPTPGSSQTYTVSHINKTETMGVVIHSMNRAASFANPAGFAARDLRPQALCVNRVVAAGSACSAAAASVNNGSSDPKGGAVTLVQAPPAPYALGNTTVVLTVTDGEGRSSNCSAIVTVQVGISREGPHWRHVWDCGCCCWVSVVEHTHACQTSTAVMPQGTMLQHPVADAGGWQTAAAAP